MDVDGKPNAHSHFAPVRGGGTGESSMRCRGFERRGRGVLSAEARLVRRLSEIRSRTGSMLRMRWPGDPCVQLIACVQTQAGLWVPTSLTRNAAGLTANRNAQNPWNQSGFPKEELCGERLFSFVVETNLPEPDALDISCLLDRSKLISDAFKVRGAADGDSRCGRVGSLDGRSAGYGARARRSGAAYAGVFRGGCVGTSRRDRLH